MTYIPIGLLADGHPRRWNSWRENHRGQPIELDGVDLSGTSLFGADLSAVNLVRASLADADLTDVDFYRAYLPGVDLTGATLTGSTLAGANLGAAKVAGANLTDATLTRATLNSADLTAANLTGANLAEANLFRTTLTRATLTNATLIGANLVGAAMSESVCDGIDFTNANLTAADLRGANLTNADLTWANLSHTDFTGANLAGADLTGTTLDGAILTGANLDGANLTHADTTHTDLSGALMTRAIGRSDPVPQPLLLPDDALAATRLEIGLGSTTSPAGLTAAVSACSTLCSLAATPGGDADAGGHIDVVGIRFQGTALVIDLVERTCAPGAAPSGPTGRGSVGDLLGTIAGVDEVDTSRSGTDPIALHHFDIQALTIEDLQERIEVGTPTTSGVQKLLTEAVDHISPLFQHGVAAETVTRTT
jgi:uncharacterized protein YjbI with pentapeptide repeats